jgi:hypothetical protein
MTLKVKGLLRTMRSSYHGVFGDCFWSRLSEARPAPQALVALCCLA